MQRESLQWVILGVYAVIVASGLVLNVLFIVSVAACLERRRSVTRLLIANLAVSDVLLLLCSFFSPLSAAQTGGWRFGALFCRLAPTVSATCTYVSSFCATAIAIHRFVSIVKSGRGKLQQKSCWLVIAAIWTTACGLATPILLNTTLRTHNLTNQSSMSTCVETWQSHVAGKAYTIASLTLQFVLPSAVIGTCYGHVSRVLSHRLHFHQSRVYHRNQQRILALIHRQRRTTRTLCLMIVAYFVCWTPLNSFVVLFVFFADAVRHWQHVSLVYIGAHLLATSSAVYNPLIYVWMHQDFRAEARNSLVVCCLRCWIQRLRPPHAGHVQKSQCCVPPSSRSGSPVTNDTCTQQAAVNAYLT